MANRLSQRVESILTVEIGDFFAEATLKKSCDLIGVNTDSLTPENIPDLAERIKKSVSFFKDKETASELANKIKDITV